MAAKDSRTSVARMRAASTASVPWPPRSAASQRRSAVAASWRTSAVRSSRPLRRMLATELRRATHPTRRCCCSRYSGRSGRASMAPLPLPCSASRAARRRSCSTACTMSSRAFSSMAISSLMYRCSKAAQAKSISMSACFSSARAGRPAAPSAKSAAWLHLPSNRPTSSQVRCSASARRMASALNSNLSPLTQITAYCSALASSTSTR
mmetsp:Transcript_33478/g.104173  ORF Transcript_33478/g.104173 Transcript_33478/m.104173 type:complete len:208 (+) Transcript_33478:64-687(+)